ncbi:MAG TPA: HipA N-terminal domain-containing protein [Kofleriaceae bacterium]|nr:HipA N-terminal domain-containing protein [Kofleriaceae bacterium]
MAERLGMPGSGNLVQEWEEGHRSIGGPIEDLLLKTLDGGAHEASTIRSLNDRAEEIWRRSGNWYETWRQVSAIPLEPAQIEATTFAKLFPTASLPHEQHVHGFPFVDYQLPREVYGLHGDRWRGVIPIADLPPVYEWMFERNGGFLNREKIWEDDKSSITHGHIHIGALFEICASVVFFIRRLASQALLSSRYRFVLDQHGMIGRGVVAQVESTPSDELRVDNPGIISTSNHQAASLDVELDTIRSYPLGVVYDLVAEAMLALRPDLCDRGKLERQLRLRHASDDRRGRIRFLGFLDAPLAAKPARRAVVSLSGRRVGLLVETAAGTRFTYDPQYVTRPDARALSPKMSLRTSPYESTGLLPYFANLLPEGVQRETLVQQRGLNEHDDFGVLLATLPAAVGNVEIHQEE